MVGTFLHTLYCRNVFCVLKHKQFVLTQYEFGIKTQATLFYNFTFIHFSTHKTQYVLLLQFQYTSFYIAMKIYAGSALPQIPMRNKSLYN